MADKIGIYFGSSTGATERAANSIKQEIEAYGFECDIAVVSTGNLGTMANYKYLLFGCPTWNIGELQDDWALVYPALGGVSFAGKKVGFFGCGDQFGYSNSFNDSIGILCEAVIAGGGEACGFYPPDPSYQFEYSRGVIDGIFMGLFLDDDNQAPMTAQRVANWVYWVLEDFGLKVPEPA